VPLTASEELAVLAADMLDYADEQLVELHGQKGKPGYSLLHSPNNRVRLKANREYKDARAEGKSSLEAQESVAVTPARTAAHEKAGGNSTLVTESGDAKPVRAGSGDDISSKDEDPGGGGLEG
jgi:hypothetical protein